MSLIFAREEFLGWVQAIQRAGTANVLSVAIARAFLRGFLEHDPKLAALLEERDRLDKRIVAYAEKRLETRR